MENQDKPKNVWNDIANTWGRIGGVVAAVGILATFVSKIWNLSPELIYSIFGGLGVVLLIISFYVDKQAEYTHQEIVKYEHKAREDFTKALDETKRMVQQNREDTERRIDLFREDVKTLLDNTKETRKDTLRIQLLMILEQQPENIDTILKLAETYFVELHGDWYMTSEFNKWAKAHNIVVPQYIYEAIDTNHKNNWK